jgi:hypothetical protein
MVQKSPKLLDQLRDEIRLKHYSIRTEEAYADRVRRFPRLPESGTRKPWARSGPRHSSTTLRLIAR